MDIEELRRLNFQGILRVDVPDAGTYTFADYRRNGYEHKPLTGYCVSCEKKQLNSSADSNDYRLTNISHGAHSSDFFLALREKPDISRWHQAPVLFVYESPSRGYDIYQEVPFEGFRKRPAKDWYWIHEDQSAVRYPSRFCGGQYGGFVLSAILTFKLANVYMTNLVKCGLNNDEGRHQGLAHFKADCIRNCYGEFLAREIEIIKPRVVFAVGSAVADWVSRLAEGIPILQQLPHPAGRRRGFRDEHYKAIYYWLTVRALHQAGIISAEEGRQLG